MNTVSTVGTSQSTAKWWKRFVDLRKRTVAPVETPVLPLCCAVCGSPLKIYKPRRSSWQVAMYEPVYVTHNTPSIQSCQWWRMHIATEQNPTLVLKWWDFWRPYETLPQCSFSQLVLEQCKKVMLGKLDVKLTSDMLHFAYLLISALLIRLDITVQVSLYMSPLAL